MKWIEDLLKAKLSGSKAKANPTLDEALWDKVSADLNHSSSIDAARSARSRRLKPVAAGGAVLLLVGIGLGVVWDEERQQDDSRPHVEDTSFDDFPSKPQAMPVEGEGGETSVSESLTLASMPQELDDEHAARVETTSPAHFSEPNEAKPEEMSNGTAVVSASGTSVALPALGSITPTATEDEIPQAFAEVLVPRIDEPTAEPLNPIKTALPLDRLQPPGAYNRASAALKRGAKTAYSRPQYFALRAYGGMTLSDFRYQNEDLVIFSDYFHAASSVVGGFALDFDFKQNHWSVGIAWSDYAQRLEFEHTWQSEYVDPEGIVAVELDPVSGDTLSVQTGPVLVTANHHRHVRDYNHWNAVVIPVEWRKEWLVTQWTVGAALGGQFLIRTGGRGQSFVDEGTLAAFDDADLSRSRLTWSPTLRVYTGYQFQPEWRLDLSVAAGWQPIGSQSNEDLTGSALTAWEGQLRAIQIAAGVTRYFELLRPPSVN